MRKLASIRVIDAIEPILGADAIEVATVGGWKVVVKKGEYQAGDLAVYLEIDSWVPHELAPFLSRGAMPREYNGVKGERLKTVKLRGQVSQGLLLPLEYGVAGFPFIRATATGAMVMAHEGQDVTEFLGIQKWERPLPGELQGQARGSFPSFIRKTDQERCQNLKKKIFEEWVDLEWEVTIKLDGSSFTGYHNHNDDTTGVCSRNLELIDDEANAGNSFVRAFNVFGVKSSLARLNGNIAIQCELMGEGIQGNREGIKGHQLYLFDIFDIDRQCYMTPTERADYVRELRYLGYEGKEAPVLARRVKLADLGITDMESLLAYAEGRSINHKTREGVVFKCETDGDISFKVISNKFLLGGGD